MFRYVVSKISGQLANAKECDLLCCSWVDDIFLFLDDKIKVPKELVFIVPWNCGGRDHIMDLLQSQMSIYKLGTGRSPQQCCVGSCR